MRPVTIVLVSASLFACGKEAAKKKEDKPVENATVSVAPKKPVETKALPPLAADPGGATGKPIWQAAFGGFQGASPKGIAVNGAGEVYVAGCYEGETDFGGTIGKKTPAGMSDAYLTKLGADGK